MRRFAFSSRPGISSLPRGATRLPPPMFLQFLTVAVLAVPMGAIAPASGQYKSRDQPMGSPSLGCGDFNYSSEAIGPLDYRTTPRHVRDLVERRHFTRDVEKLIKGSTGSVAQDISYTLRAFPNHPRALKSTAELTRRNNGGTPPGLGFSLACWFDRAVAFRPDDIQIRILWAFELIKLKDAAAALEQTRAAEELANDNAAAQYNVGLLYFDLGDYERSMANAKLAYAGGFSLPGLRDKLIRAGKWKE